MKKGFTLVELLGTITILGVIVLIAFPIARNIINNSKEELYEVQISNISDALKNWSSDNSRLLPENQGDTITITLGQLKAGGYIDSEIKNPINNKCFGNDMLLTVTRHQKNYIYNVIEETNTETDSCDEYLKPYIILNGDAIVYIEVGSQYVDLGASAIGTDGVDISDNIIVSMDGTIDTSVVGNSYTITYAITEGTSTTSVNRKVIVNDTSAPELIIPDNVVLGEDDTSFDVIEGVTATDNSGEEVNVTVKSNISFGIPGEYIITYTATDSSGNKTIKKRAIELIDLTKILASLAVPYDFNDNGLIDVDEEVNVCVKKITPGSCKVGTPFAIKVNETDVYKFYVIDDDGMEVTLILNRNLGERPAWVNEKDYGNGTVSNVKGPITALNYLNSQTENWNNIFGIKKYTYDNNLNGTENEYGYQKLEIVDGKGILISQDGKTITEITGESKARLLTHEEYVKLSGVGKHWLIENLGDDVLHWGYWFLTANSSNSSNALAVNSGGHVMPYYTVNRTSLFGIRPVIILSK